MLRLNSGHRAGQDPAHEKREPYESLSGSTTVPMRCSCSTRSARSVALTARDVAATSEMLKREGERLDHYSTRSDNIRPAVGLDRSGMPPLAQLVHYERLSKFRWSPRRNRWQDIAEFDQKIDERLAQQQNAETNASRFTSNSRAPTSATPPRTPHGSANAATAPRPDRPSRSSKRASRSSTAPSQRPSSSSRKPPQPKLSTCRSTGAG
jgi:hypothetical protein